MLPVFNIEQPFIDIDWRQAPVLKVGLSHVVVESEAESVHKQGMLKLGKDVNEFSVVRVCGVWGEVSEDVSEGFEGLTWVV